MAKLFMNIYNGRTDPDQPIVDRGTQGPVLFNMTCVHYQRGNILLAFINDEKRDTAQALSGWPSTVHIPYGMTKPCLMVPFSLPRNKREFVVCKDSLTQVETFYVDFLVRTRGLVNPQMQMRLMMEEQYAKVYPSDKRELLLTGISELYFTDGKYQLRFNTTEAMQRARAVTGWTTGTDPDHTLEVFLSAANEVTVLRNSALSSGHPVFFERFELMSM